MGKVNPYEWHFVDSKHIPRYVKRKFHFSGHNYVGPIEGNIEDSPSIKGRHYEWKLVGVIGDHTHDEAIICRKLTKTRHHNKQHRGFLQKLWRKLFG